MSARAGELAMLAGGVRVCGRACLLGCPPSGLVSACVRALVRSCLRGGARACRRKHACDRVRLVFARTRACVCACARV